MSETKFPLDESKLSFDIPKTDQPRICSRNRLDMYISLKPIECPQLIHRLIN